MMVFTVRARALRVVCLALLACLTLSGLSLGQTRAPSDPRGRVNFKVPDPTEDGNWDGTWFYMNLDFRMALWARTVDGKPQFKLRYLHLASGEGFETDWSGHADYNVRSTPASFSMTLEEGDANRARATWDWDLDFGGEGRWEDGKIDIFRAGRGNTMVLHFTEWARRVQRAGSDRTYEVPQSWSFRKASKRQVRWEELPF